MTTPLPPHPDPIDTTHSALRASDTDREQAANTLRDHCANGRLAPDELAERLEDAYHARTLGDLNVLFDDLPEAGSSTTIKRRRTISPRLPRQMLAIPTAAALASLAAVTDPHLLWLAWPLLAIYRLHRRRHPNRPVAGCGPIAPRF